ncbi:YD repeat-containing protein [Lentzea atacamensis]|uniref:YD repeat-containing protein n=2 Tax=Lentzea atacamensis TaxID=531938 RepID=A0ABX9E114_9PSEU|nr:RHS repeat domain-containing protein [Lentzea atacamensis]RAS61845.1 YD repeat-containing protein [Lentzea atacamensis]
MNCWAGAAADRLATPAAERLSVTDPTGPRVETTYDDLGHAVTSTQLERYPTPSAFTTKMTYDDGGRLTTVTSPSNEVTTFGYDTLGQRVSSTDPAGVVTKLGYDSIGRQNRVSDGLNRTTFQTFDTAGRPATQYSLDASETLLRSTRNHYDRAGNVVKTTDPLNRATTFTYDAMNRVIGQVEPVAKVVRSPRRSAMTLPATAPASLTAAVTRPSTPSTASALVSRPSNRRRRHIPTFRTAPGPLATIWPVTLRLCAPPAAWSAHVRSTC